MRSTIAVTKEFTFEAAHRLFEYDGPCANLHGHSYRVEVSVTGEINDEGMVLDFGWLSTTVGKWIDENWDHAAIMNSADPAAQMLAKLKPSDVFLTVGNPTAENMAGMLLRDICPSVLPEGVKATKVVIWETAKCRAEATL